MNLLSHGPCLDLINFCSFNGIIVRPQHYKELTPDQFQQRLAGEKSMCIIRKKNCNCTCMSDFSASLEAWRSDGKRGVWVKIPLSQAELVPIAAKVSIYITPGVDKGIGVLNYCSSTLLTLIYSWLHKRSYYLILSCINFFFHSS